MMMMHARDDGSSVHLRCASIRGCLATIRREDPHVIQYLHLQHACDLCLCLHHVVRSGTAEGQKMSRMRRCVLNASRKVSCKRAELPQARQGKTEGHFVYETV
jgi:hypothetical protein